MTPLKHEMHVGNIVEVSVGWYVSYGMYVEVEGDEDHSKWGYIDNVDFDYRNKPEIGSRHKAVVIGLCPDHQDRYQTIRLSLLPRHLDLRERWNLYKRKHVVGEGVVIIYVTGGTDCQGHATCRLRGHDFSAVPADRAETGAIRELTRQARYKPAINAFLVGFDDVNCYSLIALSQDAHD